MEDDQAGDEISYSISLPWSQQGESLSDSEKAEALADNLETQFQPVTDRTVPAVIVMVDVALRSYFLSLASEPQLTTPHEVHEAIKGLKLSKVPTCSKRTRTVARAVMFRPMACPCSWPDSKE